METFKGKKKKKKEKERSIVENKEIKSGVGDFTDTNMGFS